MLGLAFLAWTAYQRADATADCEADQLRAELTEAKRQLAVVNEIAENARLRADQAQVELQNAMEASNELQRTLDASGASCPIPDDVRDGLLRIR